MMMMAVLRELSKKFSKLLSVVGQRRVVNDRRLNIKVVTMPSTDLERSRTQVPIYWTHMQ